jgi:hypothetical protein
MGKRPDVVRGAFRVRSYDRVMDRPLYQAGGSPMDLLHQSITEVGEHDFIEMFLRDVYYRNAYLNIKDLNADDAVIWKDIPLRKFRKSIPGDVDILIVPRGRPEQSTAIQVKRYKIRIVSDDADYSRQIERMAELFKEGVRQANENDGLGFSQVYLWIAILIDSRVRNQGRYTYDGPDSRLRSAIQNTIFTANLHTRVGLITNEFVQAMDRPPFELSSSGLHLQRLATAAPQPEDLTRWLETLQGRRYVAQSWTRKSSPIESGR